MSEPSPAVLHQRTGAIARITLNRPESRNALSAEVMAGLREARLAAQADAGTRVVVLTGAGEKAFCAGGDLGGSASSTMPCRPRPSTPRSTSSRAGSRPCLPPW